MLQENEIKSVENGVTIPPSKGKRPSYPFRAMEVGHSFFVEIGTEVTLPELKNKALNELQRKLSAVSTMAGKRLGMKFQTRRNENGIRIWRIA
jgi:hypothetical protein